MRFILIFVLILCACSTSIDQEQKRLIKIKEITFPLGFAPSRMNHFEDENHEFFGFLDYQTFKKFSVFNSKGDFIYSFSIKELMERSGRQFNSFSFQSIDTIAFLSRSGTNHLVVLDSIGNVLLEKDYSFLYKKEVSIYAPFILSNNVIRAVINYHDTIPVTKIDREYYKNFFNKKIQFYNVMMDTLFTLGTEPSLQIDSFYSRFTTDEEWSTEVNKILYLEDKNIIYSAYSDSIYSYDLKGKLLNIKPIISKKHKLRVNPLSIDGKLDIVENIDKHTHISHLLWDKYRSLYYCFVPEEVKENGETPFTIIVLDSDFNTLSEIDMDCTQYFLDKFEYFPAFVGKEGLYIMNKSKNIKETTFSILRYE